MQANDISKRHWLGLGFSTVLALMPAVAVLGTAPGAAMAQGVPVHDNSNLVQNIEQLQSALRDAENQIEQIEQLRRQIELALQQITNLEGILGSVSGANEIAGLFNSAADLRSRAAKVADPSGFIENLSIGNFDGLLASLLDGDVTMGDKRAAEAMEATLAGAGFTRETLSSLNDPENPKGAAIADLAATNAAAIGASQIAYEEAAQSLERIDGLVAEIANQTTLKESVDLNTRMAAETNYMLGQMWRLNAAAGLAAGQNGIDFAAEQAQTRAFFRFGPEEVTP
jgi:type IV secretion system protein VirB5